MQYKLIFAKQSIIKMLTFNNRINNAGCSVGQCMPRSQERKRRAKFLLMQLLNYRPTKACQNANNKDEHSAHKAKIDTTTRDRISNTVLSIRTF